MSSPNHPPTSPNNVTDACHPTGITVTQKQASLAMSGLSVAIVFWLLSHIFWVSLAASGFLCSAHILFRDASMLEDKEDKVAMQGDWSVDAGAPEEASFLNR